MEVAMSLTVNSLDTDRILIVENDPDIREALSDLLLYDGHRVDAVRLMAVEEMMSQTYGTALVDIPLPEINDSSVVETMQARDPSLPIIVLTGRLSEEKKTALLHQGVFTSLAIPYDSSEVKRVVRRAMEVRRLTLGAARNVASLRSVTPTNHIFAQCRL
jgi:DNA-binding NtrC family response regulator